MAHPRHRLPPRTARGDRGHLPPGVVALHGRRSASTGTGCRSGTKPAPPTWTRKPARCCPPGTRRSTPLPTQTSRCTSQGSGPGSTPRACWPDRRDANRCIGYLTKYLTKQLGDCHELGTDAQHGARRAARRGAALGTLLTGLRELAPLRHPAQERQEGPAARRLQGQGAPPRIPRLRRPPRADLPQMVRQDAGRPPRRPEEPG